MCALRVPLLQHTLVYVMPHQEPALGRPRHTCLHKAADVNAAGHDLLGPGVRHQPQRRERLLGHCRLRRRGQGAQGPAPAHDSARDGKSVGAMLMQGGGGGASKRAKRGARVQSSALAAGAAVGTVAPHPSPAALPSGGYRYRGNVGARGRRAWMPALPCPALQGHHHHHHPRQQQLGWSQTEGGLALVVARLAPCRESGCPPDRPSMCCACAAARQPGARLPHSPGKVGEARRRLAQQQARRTRPQEVPARTHTKQHAVGGRKGKPPRYTKVRGTKRRDKAPERIGTPGGGRRSLPPAAVPRCVRLTPGAPHTCSVTRCRTPAARRRGAPLKSRRPRRCRHHRAV